MITRIQELGDVGITVDPVRHLTSARVAVADYELLKRDFPQLRDCARAEVDEWLVEHAAVISEAQLKSVGVNSDISVVGPSLPSYRPARYGRATIVDVSGGLFDLKGVGVRAGRIPARSMYETGLEYLGVALSDFMIKCLLDAIFSRTVPSLSTVPVYAVLDLGLDILDGWNGTAPAGLHVRAAHKRAPEPVGFSGSDGEELSVFIELLLRSYGLTSVNQGNCLVIEDRNGGQLFVSSSDREISHALDAEDVQRLRDFKGDATELRIERINLQLAGDLDARARRAQLYDFGHINVRAEFHNPLASTVSDQWLCIGGVLWPDSPAFVRPHPQLAAPLAEWHKYSLNDFCFGLARDFRMQTIDRAMVQEAMENRLRSLVNGWPAAVHELAAAPETR